MTLLLYNLSNSTNKFRYKAKWNNKGSSVETSHRYINKSVSIPVQDRDILNTFFSVRIVAGHPWNRSLIDGSDTIRSVSAIDKDFINISLHQWK